MYKGEHTMKHKLVAGIIMGNVLILAGIAGAALGVDTRKAMLKAAKEQKDEFQRKKSIRKRLAR